jgi:anti-anti-sigma regulatory factor
MGLKVSVTRNAPRARVILVGSLDQGTARVLRLRSQSLLVTGHRHLLLDLRELTDVDDVGVATVAYVRRIYAIAGGTTLLLGLDFDLEVRLMAVEAATLAPGAA